MRLLAVALAASVALVAGCDSSGTPGSSPRPEVDRFDSGAAWRLLKQQVALGPRPAGSRASRRLARRLRRLLPRGRYQPVPDGLRNVVGRVPGRSRRYVVVGAHYDTKDIPGFVGANDGASGTAVVTQLARTVRPGRLRRTLVFILFDGEESPRGTPDAEFELRGLRGSSVAANRFGRAEAMVLLDFVGEKGLRLPREANSSAALWRELRSAARRVGVGRTFPADTRGPVSDDHLPFIRIGVPSIDLIDFDFPCFHRRCDDLSVVSERSLDAVGEAVYELLRGL
jgi:glutaminyl-peptide cyclotransferase